MNFHTYPTSDTSMKFLDPDCEMYRLCTDDVQCVASHRLGRWLTASELETVQNRIPNYIEWFDSIMLCIDDEIVD